MFTYYSEKVTLTTHKRYFNKGDQSHWSGKIVKEKNMYKIISEFVMQVRQQRDVRASEKSLMFIKAID